MDNQGFDPARNLWLQISSRRKGLGFDPKNSERKTVDGHHLLSLPKPTG